MREYDDNNIQHYAPVLRRIIILVAVITAVPVMLWTITAFMRTYVAQPTIPAPRPLAAASDSTDPSAAPVTAGQAIVEARATTTDARSADTDNRSDRLPDSANAAPSADVKVATIPITQPGPAAPAPQPASAAVAMQPAALPPPAPADSVFPNPAAALAGQLPQQSAAPDATDDALPPADPITGPVPLPRHRPNVFAFAETGAVPLPRARPGDAPSAPEPVIDTPRSGYDPGIGRD